MTTIRHLPLAALSLLAATVVASAPVDVEACSCIRGDLGFRRTFPGDGGTLPANARGILVQSAYVAKAGAGVVVVEQEVVTKGKDGKKKTRRVKVPMVMEVVTLPELKEGDWGYGRNLRLLRPKTGAFAPGATYTLTVHAPHVLPNLLMPLRKDGTRAPFKLPPNYRTREHRVRFTVSKARFPEKGALKAKLHDVKMAKLRFAAGASCSRRYEGVIAELEAQVPEALRDAALYTIEAKGFRRASTSLCSQTRLGRSGQQAQHPASFAIPHRCGMRAGAQKPTILKDVRLVAAIPGSKIMLRSKPVTITLVCP